MTRNIWEGMGYADGPSRINLMNHMDEMNCSVEETQPPFPGSVLAHWNHE